MAISSQLPNFTVVSDVLLGICLKCFPGASRNSSSHRGKSPSQSHRRSAWACKSCCHDCSCYMREVICEIWLKFNILKSISTQVFIMHFHIGPCKALLILHLNFNLESVHQLCQGISPNPVLWRHCLKISAAMSPNSASVAKASHTNCASAIMVSPVESRCLELGYTPSTHTTIPSHFFKYYTFSRIASRQEKYIQRYQNQLSI